MPTTQTVSFQGRVIDDVPPELLVEICSINARRNPWSEDHLQENVRRPQSRLPQDILDTIHASHVCRRWREILISVPRLWKNMVDPYDIEWSDTILERSTSLGVAFVPFRGPRGDRSLKTELAMVERLHERLAEYHVDQVGRHFPTIPDHLVFSTLEILSISGNGRFPQTFPGEATPVLKTLHLAYGDSPSFECLTTISRTLTRLFVIRPYKTRAVTFWGGLLSQLPCLEVIALKFCFARVDYDLVDSRTIFQSNVQEFSVHDFGEHLLAFVPRIEFGKSLIRLTVKGHLSIPADAIHLPDLESHLIRSFSDKASRIIQHDTLGFAGTWVFDLYFGNSLDYHLSNNRGFISPLSTEQGMRNRWFMDISCLKPPSFPDVFPNFLTPQSCSHVDVLNISYFNSLWESLCPVFSNFTNLQAFRATPSVVLKFMHRINSSIHATTIFPTLRGIYLDTSNLTVSGYRDTFPSNTGVVDDEDLNSRISLLTQDWGDQSDGSYIYSSDSSDDSDSDQGDEVEEVIDKDGNRWDDRSFVQEFESISVEQIEHFCKARPSIQFVSFPNIPETASFVILRERLAEMGVEIRKHYAKCLNTSTE